MNTERIAADEKQRLTSLLFSCDVSEDRVKMLDAVIDNTAWMKAKLDEAREQIRNTSVAIPYKNGTQTGIHENPLFKGYHNLWKSYMAGMNVIMSNLPRTVVEDEAEKIETPKTILQIVREKHNKTA